MTKQPFQINKDIVSPSTVYYLSNTRFLLQYLRCYILFITKCYFLTNMMQTSHSLYQGWKPRDCPHLFIISHFALLIALIASTAVFFIESAFILCLYTQGMHLPHLTYLVFHILFQVSSYVLSHVLSHILSRLIFRVLFIPCFKYPVPYVWYLLSFMSRAQIVSKIFRQLRLCLNFQIVSQTVFWLQASFCNQSCIR